MDQFLNQLSGFSTLLIAGAFACHLFLFLILKVWSRRELQEIVGTLDDFTRGLKHRSVLDRRGHLVEQVDAFLADVQDILNHPEQSRERKTLNQRMNILDEKRSYMHSMFFETVYNMARNMIDAYPLMGVLGTILAIGAALQIPPEAAVSAGAVSGVEAIVGRFGEAIWSTFAGLVAGIILMFVNSLVEPGFLRLSESRQHVREMIARVKRELAFDEEEPKP
ncbi:MAG TPA: MotA/TolQ/ExbB proton channel family protein [Planctomycetaceae bacterium]|nr:MotA/TolQ/ExbB proton channel family protein [Planctomycetaceae bacterium]